MSTKNNWLISLLLVTTLLVSCRASDPQTLVDKPKNWKNPSLDEKIVEKDPLVSNKRIIKDLKNRNDTTQQYGPEIYDYQSAEAQAIRDKQDIQINKEDSPSYVNIKNSDAVKIFPIDLNVENVEIRTVAEMLAEITGINILVSDEVNGNVTVKIHDVPWPDALDTILSMKSLAKHIDETGNIISIHSQEKMVQLETYERQRKEDQQKAIALQKSEDTLYTQIFKLFYSKPDKVKDIIQGVLGKDAKTDASGRNTNAQITVDERRNAVIVKARKSDIDIIKNLIMQVDSRTKQIFIEAFIVEVTDDFEKAFGANLGMNAVNQGKSIGTTVVGAAGGTSTGLTPLTNDSSLVNLPINGASSGISLLGGIGNANQLKVSLTAMEADGFSKIISNPKIFTLDNQQAVIFQGTEIPYQSSSGNNGTNIQFKDAGLKLAVTPSVVGDGNLMMQIEVDKDSANTSETNPPITRSQITTNLVTKTGSIVVIGGIYTQTKSDTNNKVPVVADIPILGRLFRSDDRSDKKYELMIFLAPTVI